MSSLLDEMTPSERVEFALLEIELERARADYEAARLYDLERQRLVERAIRWQRWRKRHPILADILDAAVQAGTALTRKH